MYIECLIEKCIVNIQRIIIVEKMYAFNIAFYSLYSGCKTKLYQPSTA